jgi:beta-glucosidase
MLTLCHGDWPTALDRLGGWLNPDSAHWFADYAQVLFRALDDRVKLWVTLNDPGAIVDGGYVQGVLPPGLRNLYAAPVAAHHLLRAHAATVQAYRAEGRHQIGLAVNLEPKYPATETVEDLNATMRADAYSNRYFLIRCCWATIRRSWPRFSARPGRGLPMLIWR